MGKLSAAGIKNAPQGVMSYLLNIHLFLLLQKFQ